MADENQEQAAAAPAPDPVPAAPVADAPAAAAAEQAAPASEKPAYTGAHAEPTLLETIKSPGTEEQPAAEAKADGTAKPEDKPADVAAKPAEAKAPEVKAEEKGAEEAAKPADAAPDDGAAEAAPPALEPLEYKYELPETITLNDDQRKEFHGALDEFRKNPADPTALIKLHDKAMSDYATQVVEDQNTAWTNVRKEWRKEIMADPELGGSGYDTVSKTVARMRDALASAARPGTPEYAADMAALDGFMRVTGAGDHPVFWRILHNASRYIDEPQAERTPANIQPVAQPNAKNGREALYDNPRSKPNGSA